MNVLRQSETDAGSKQNVKKKRYHHSFGLFGLHTVMHCGYWSISEKSEKIEKQGLSSLFDRV